MVQEFFFFCFDFEDAAASLFGRLYVLFYGHCACSGRVGVPVLAWCVVFTRVRSRWVGLVAPSQWHPV